MTTPATTPLTYNGYVSQIATMAVVNTTTSSGVVVGVDPAFNAIIPQMLNYAELRIQRDLDLLPSQTTNTSYNLTSGSNTLSISVNDFVTLQTVSLVSGTAQIPLLPVTKEYLQNVWNDSSYLSQPQYFAVYGGDLATAGNTSQNIIVGPYPNSAYSLVITGTIRMPTLYQYATPSQAGTSTTFISTYLPDMLIMASMVYISAYQRNFGRMSDDPAMAQSYEGQYQVLLRGATGEEYRKKFEASAWTSYSTSPPATPTRGQ
jgi:hypothetical protein